METMFTFTIAFKQYTVHTQRANNDVKMIVYNTYVNWQKTNLIKIIGITLHLIMQAHAVSFYGSPIDLTWGIAPFHGIFEKFFTFVSSYSSFKFASSFSLQQIIRSPTRCYCLPSNVQQFFYFSSLKTSFIVIMTIILNQVSENQRKSTSVHF